MRIRTIKPEFLTHEGLFELEQETGLPIRIAFAGLWCAADRDPNHEAKVIADAVEVSLQSTKWKP